MSQGAIITDRSGDLGNSLGDDGRGMLHVFARILGSNIPTYDAVVASYPDNVTEVYQFKVGGTSGTLKKTATIVYTDSTKALLQSVAWT